MSQSTLAPAVAPTTPRRSVRPWLMLSPAAARWIRRAGGIALVLVIGVLAYLLRTRGIPRSPEAGVLGRSLEVPIQAALLVLLALGGALSLRWHRTGAVVIAAAAAVLGYLSSVQYAPAVAAAVTAAAGLPAFLLWLSWQHAVTRRTAVELAVVTLLVLATVVGAAERTYSSVFGPSHPASSAPAPSRELVDWAWTGGVTDDSVTVRARTRRDAQEVRLLLSQADGSGSIVVPAVRSAGDERVFAATATGLQPGTDYSWQVEVDGRVDPLREGSVRTFPLGPASFTLAVGSCALTGSNGAVFDAIAATDPLLFVVSGDYLYANIDRDDVQRFRDSYAASLRAPGQAALFARVPVAYVWDDHDYSGNDGDRDAVSRAAAHRAYDESVPHYPLLLGADEPVLQAFTVGRVRVVLTDNRSARSPATTPDGPGKTMLGVPQRERLLAELRAADRYAAVIWVNPSPWVSPPRAGADDWGGYAWERTLIADAIATEKVDNLVMVGGDAHMVAYDDGTNTDFSTRGGAGFPLLHAAALDRGGGVKGGPYSGGTFPGGGQFGTVTVQDDGTTTQVTLTGRDWTGRTLLSHTVDLTPDGGGGGPR